jgi:phage gp36-like protein
MPTTITSYLTSSDLAAAISANELIQLLDDPVNPTGTLNTTRRDELLTRVQGIMESRLAVIHALPLVVETAEATRIAATLRGYALSIFRWLAIHDQSHAEEQFRGLHSAYKDALAWLADVAADKAKLGTSKALPSAEARSSGAQTATNVRTFSRDRLAGW